MESAGADVSADSAFHGTIFEPVTLFLVVHLLAVVARLNRALPFAHTLCFLPTHRMPVLLLPALTFALLLHLLLTLALL